MTGNQVFQRWSFKIFLSLGNSPVKGQHCFSDSRLKSQTSCCSRHKYSWKAHKTHVNYSYLWTETEINAHLTFCWGFLWMQSKKSICRPSFCIASQSQSSQNFIQILIFDNYHENYVLNYGQHSEGVARNDKVVSDFKLRTLCTELKFQDFLAARVLEL